MNEQVSSTRPHNVAKYMSLPWLIAFVGGLSVMAVVALVLGKEFGGLFGLTIRSIGWCVIFAASWFVTCKYANPILPILCGVMAGWTFPRPSDEWFVQLAGARWGSGASLMVVVVAGVIGMTIFSTIAQRHKASSDA